MPSYENQQNSALSYIEFLVTTHGGLSEGDKILVKLPTGWQFSQSSRATGQSNNMAESLESTLSTNYRQIEITVELALSL